MNRVLLGAILGLVLVGVGFYWWQSVAQVEELAPEAPPEPAEEAPGEEELPLADPGDMTGPAPPEASELTKEEQRFFRYDRNRDQIISRNEMLSTRSAAFRKLDVDGNNLLTFEEWAVTTVTRFEGADGNGDNELSKAEFASTRPKPKPKSTPSCRC